MSNAEPSQQSTRRHQASRLLRWCGWGTVWAQGLLALFSGVILLLFVVFRPRTGTAEILEGTQLGIGLAFAGLIALCVSAYWAWRFIRIGHRLLDEELGRRPSKVETLREVRLALLVNLIGMLFTIVGTQATVGTFVVLSLSQPQGAFVSSPGEAVQSLDLFVIQANINTILAHFIGICVCIWLYTAMVRADMTS